MHLHEVTAVVLAGGFGTRVRHLLPDVPKPMAPVAGRPFLEWVVRYLSKQGIRKVVLSTGYLSQVVERHFEKNPVTGVSTRCIPETEPLGTGGGFLNAVRASRDTAPAWMALNGDSLAFADLSSAAAEFDDRATGGVLLGCSVPDASRYGTLAIGPAGRLLGFLEKSPGHGIINAGVYLFRDSLVHEFPSTAPLSFERDVFPALTARGAQLKVAVVNGPFLDIGTPESLQQAEAFVNANQAQFALV